MTNTAEVKGVTALLDSGAMGLFIDSDFALAEKLTLRPLTRPAPMYNVDGTPNEGGAIHNVVDVILRFRGHSEHAVFAVTNLGKHKIILGYPWLREHNPKVNWQTQEVTLSQCPSQCHTCRAKIREERKEELRIRACRMGPMPQLVEEEEGDTEQDVPGDVEQLLDEGDRLFATVSTPEVPVIAATNMSQQLAERALRSKPAKEKECIPLHLHNFEDVFTKESFDSLPSRRTWDHPVELEPGVKTSACKVYPLSPSEQLQLDKFLKENLRTGRIHPSKSPMASPVFFIKKKDGSLQLVQDYRVLNAMTMKNRYPLLIIPELIAQLRGVKYFTKLDVRWGFNNVRIKDGDEWKAAFRTNHGLFEPLVMFFRLTNSPATFQTMMNDIFQDLIMEGHVCVYMDDILIFTDTLEENRHLW